MSPRLCAIQAKRERWTLSLQDATFPDDPKQLRLHIRFLVAFEIAAQIWRSRNNSSRCPMNIRLSRMACCPKSTALASTNIFTDMTSLVTARQKLESQQQENKGVQNVRLSLFLVLGNRKLNDYQEFNSLADDANIYKLVGPVLLKQDTTEAKSTVDGRLEYIGGEMYGASLRRGASTATDYFIASVSRTASRKSPRRAKRRKWR